MKNEKVAQVLFRTLSINSDPVVVRLKDRALTPLAKLMITLRISPMLLTSFSLLLGFLAGLFVVLGLLRFAGLFLFTSLILDGLDGLVARATNKQTIFGAFADGVCDRYVDLVVLLSLVWYFFMHGYTAHSVLACVAIIGTTITSYSTPQALSLSLVSTKKQIGFFGRVQRILVLVISFLFPSLVFAAAWILAVFSNMTALHRIWHYYLISREHQELPRY